MSASSSTTSDPAQGQSSRKTFYEDFDFWNAPLPDGFLAIIKKPIYDESFDIVESMRSAGYPPFQMPKEIVVKKILNPISPPSGDVITIGNYKGRRDYISKLTGLPEELLDHGRNAGNTSRFQTRQPVRQPYNLRQQSNDGEYKGPMRTRRQGTPRMRGGKGEGPDASLLNTSMFQATKQLSSPAVASRSTSSHHTSESMGGPICTMYSSSDQRSWTAAGEQSNVMQSGYMNMRNYNPTNYAANGQMATDMGHAMAAVAPVEVATVVKEQNVDQDCGVGDVNEFFVSNPYPHAKTSNAVPSTGITRTHPIAIFENANTFKSPMNIGYESQGQMHSAVMAQQLYAQQHGLNLLTTTGATNCPTPASNGEAVAKFLNYDFSLGPAGSTNNGTNQYPSSAYNTYDAVRRMPIEEMKELYLPKESPDSYQQPIIEHPDDDRMQNDANRSETKFDSSDEEDSKWVEKSNEEETEIVNKEPCEPTEDSSEDRSKISGSVESMDISDDKDKKEEQQSSSCTEELITFDVKKKKKSTEDPIHAEKTDKRETKEKKREKESVADSSENKRSDERRDRKDDRLERRRSDDRREREHRDERSERSKKDDSRSDDSHRPRRQENDNYGVSNKRPRRDDFDTKRSDRGRDNREWSRGDDRRRDDTRGRNPDSRNRGYQRNDDRRDYGGQRRGYRGGNGGNGNYRSSDRDRYDEKSGGYRGGYRNRDREDRSVWDKRPSAEEVAKQKKLLWGKSTCEAETGSGAHSAGEATSSALKTDKNVGLWSSAITASGVGGEQANKFLKLMGIKNAPAVAPTPEDTRLKEESEKQRKVMLDLDRQYEIARETTHMGRGLGLGFHQ